MPSFISPSFVAFVLAILPATVNALRLPVEVASLGHPARRAAPTDSSVPLATFQNIQYIVNITVGGQVYPTVIDTGSSDMWIYGNVSNTTPTNQSAGLSYAIGEVDGDILLAPLSFAGYKVPSQAFIEVQNISSFGADPRMSGYTALVGLGPLSGSVVYNAFNTSTGFPMMNNIFTQNLTNESYVTLLLPRAHDPDSNATALPIVITGQEGLQHWTALTDANGVLGSNGQPINVTTNVTSATGTGKLVAVFDSGFSLPQVPKAISDALYSGLPGAQLVNFPVIGELWEIPCTQEVNVTFIFGGQKIFVHPLDANAAEFPDQAINSSSVCYGAFQPIGADAVSPDYDMILGMSFLRNAYTLLDYGSFNLETLTDMNDPFIQFLATTNTTQAHNDFVNLHINNNGTAPTKNNGPEFSTTSAAMLSFSPRAEYWSFMAAGMAVVIGCM
ncbi:hypothetical protein FRB97_001013 [Tulasnella sp. 331]|nr:hypothetical protein FRB97_001013 [Tulasnella sp. 331]KAG8889648.1 hypothetical protein FRB98_003451 [Tulasnella sp. 332]